MKSAPNRFWLLPALALLAISALALRSREALPAAAPASATGASHPTLATLPQVIIWAWERPEKLSFIDPRKVGVAFLAKTIYLRDDDVVTRPRLQPLELPEGTRLVAVVRMEPDRRDVPRLTTSQLLKASAEIVELAKLPNVFTVQIDFDATVSQRNFYRELLKNVRRQLPDLIPLSITALASWCAADNWLSDLPIDEAVPMLFRMGVDNRHFKARLNAGQAFESSACQHSAGISTDEPITLPTVQRLYIFNPRPWSKDSLNRAMEAYIK